MISTSIIGAIIGHFVGDFLLQDGRMARLKRTDSLVCAWHCSIWTMAVCTFSECWALPVISLLWVSHFFLDRSRFVEWFMDNTGKRGFRTHPMFVPWSAIVHDQTWHMVSIWLIWRFVV